MNCKDYSAGVPFLIKLIPLIFFSLNIQAAKMNNKLDVSQFKFHKVSGADLPFEKVVGNMDEVLSALNKQITNCKNNRGRIQTILIANHRFKRQEWCLDTNMKMLHFATAAQGDFKKFLLSIKTEFDWYQSEGWPQNHGIFKKGDFKFTAYYSGAHRRTPYGTENIPLTAHTSCATDHRIIPVGMNLLINYKKSTSFCIAQDSGSAVKGAHVDLYKGKGHQAGVEVKNLYYPGTLFIALPKSK